MPLEYQFLVFTVIGLVIGVIVTLILLKSRNKKLLELAKAENNTELKMLSERLQVRDNDLSNYKLKVEEYTQKVTSLESQKNELDKNLAVSKQKNEQIPNLEHNVKEKSATIESLQTEVRELSSRIAKEIEKNKQIDELAKEIENKESSLEELRQNNSHQKAMIAELRTRSEEEKLKFEEQRETLLQAKKELTDQFKTLAQEIFEEKGKKFTEQNQTKLDTLLSPFREQLKEFKKKVDDVYVNEAKERASLKKELENLQTLNKQISQDAINLTNALKGDVKTQGNWGELILERVLEQSGLRKGIEYETQTGFRDSEDHLLKPDVVIHMPEEKDFVVDSKVSLVDYEKYSSSNDETERDTALKAHISSIRKHIDSLADKDYTSLKGIRTLDFVLMFIPIEAAFMVAFQNDDHLFSHAFSKRIIIVTPTTLLATLKTIESIWRYERQSQNAQKIVDRASSIYDKLRGFVEDMEKLGKQFSTTNRTYENAMGKLTRGKGNLINQAQQFVEMGVKIKKQIPKTVMDVSEVNVKIEDTVEPLEIENHEQNEVLDEISSQIPELESTENDIQEN